MGEDVLEQEKKIEFGVHSLTDEQKLYVCREIGRFKNNCQIVKELKENYGVTCTDQNIAWYRKSPSWQEHILAFRKVYIDTISNIPLVHKKIRLVELQKMFDLLKNQEGSISPIFHKNALEILKAVKDEVEAKTEIYRGVYELVSGEDGEKLSVEVLRIVEQLESEIKSGKMGSESEELSEVTSVGKGEESPRLLLKEGNSDQGGLKTVTSGGVTGSSTN